MPTATTGPAFTPHSIGRLFATIFPDAESVSGERPLELTADRSEPPRLIDARVIEGHELRARRVFEPPTVEIAAFLDGRQHSEVVSYRPGGVPVVVGTVGAVVRERRNQRLYTWSHRVERAIYAPKVHLSSEDWRLLSTIGLPVRDTTEGQSDPPIGHPLALGEAAIHAVQKDREGLETELAMDWCGRENRQLLIDGGISGVEQVARSQCAVGVVKSHRSLYAQGAALNVVLHLGPSERSSVFLVTSPKRTSVASWYLRLHDRRGHDPMWGLVRVEVAAPTAGREDDITRRADEVSRWILAEVSPVALPDARWDKMVYGVRDCEEFLRAVM
jgi:hypothetical protein